MDARTRADIDQKYARIADAIRTNGWLVQYVTNDECPGPHCDIDPEKCLPFGYTVGLFGFGHPELLVIGMPVEHTVRVLGELAHRVHTGENLVPGVEIAADDFRIVPEEVPNPGDIVFVANSYYQRPDEASVPVLQLTYDDGAGRFPWDVGCNVARLQPRPGTFSARI